MVLIFHVGDLFDIRLTPYELALIVVIVSMIAGGLVAYIARDRWF